MPGFMNLSPKTIFRILRMAHPDDEEEMIWSCFCTNKRMNDICTQAIMERGWMGEWSGVSMLQPKKVKVVLQEEEALACTSIDWVLMQPGGAAIPASRRKYDQLAWLRLAFSVTDVSGLDITVWLLDWRGQGLNSYLRRIVSLTTRLRVIMELRIKVILAPRTNDMGSGNISNQLAAKWRNLVDSLRAARIKCKVLTFIVKDMNPSFHQPETIQSTRESQSLFDYARLRRTKSVVFDKPSSKPSYSGSLGLKENPQRKRDFTLFSAPPLPDTLRDLVSKLKGAPDPNRLAIDVLELDTQLPFSPFCFNSTLSLLDKLSSITLSYLHDVSANQWDSIFGNLARSNRISNVKLQRVANISPRHIFPFLASAKSLDALDIDRSVGYVDSRNYKQVTISLKYLTRLRLPVDYICHLFHRNSAWVIRTQDPGQDHMKAFPALQEIEILARTKKTTHMTYLTLHEDLPRLFAVLDRAYNTPRACSSGTVSSRVPKVKLDVQIDPFKPSQFQEDCSTYDDLQQLAPMDGHLNRRGFYLVKELVLSWHPDLYNFFHREVRASVSHRRPGTSSSFMSTSSDGGTRYKGRLNEEVIRQICIWVMKLFPSAPILRLGRPLNEDAICEAYASEEIPTGKGNGGRRNGGPERRWTGPENALADDRSKGNSKVRRRALLVRGVTNQIRLAFSRHYEFSTEMGPPRGLNPWSEEHSAPGYTLMCSDEYRLKWVKA